MVEIEPMEEYSEAKTYKSKPELRKSKVNADLFLFISGNNNYCQSHVVFLIFVLPARKTRSTRCNTSKPIIIHTIQNNTHLIDRSP